MELLLLLAKLLKMMHELHKLNTRLRAIRKISRNKVSKFPFVGNKAAGCLAKNRGSKISASF
jgi:hypothetical protein